MKLKFQNMYIFDRLMKLNMEQYKTFLEDLAKTKKVELSEIMNKMASCGDPGVSSSVSIAVSSPINYLPIN